MVQTELALNSRPSQARFLLARLKEAGKYGVTTRDCYKWGIWRGASRINELRKQGYDIQTVETKPVARYVLNVETEQADVA